MAFKAPNIKVKNMISASHHPTNVGGALTGSSIKKTKMKIPKVSESTNMTRSGLSKFKNLMRFLKQK